MNRQNDLIRIADNIKQLAIGGGHTERFSRDPGPGHDGIRRSKPEPGTWRTSHRGLIVQLVAALPRGASGGADNNRPAGKPSSRQPSTTHVSDLLDEISVEAHRLRGYLARNGGRPTARQRHTVISDLLDVRALVHAAGDEDVAEIAGVVQRWVRVARTVLAMDAPVASLRDVTCPYCKGELKVRSDASGDVWCGTRGCVDPNGKRPTWPKEQWPFMLEQIGGGRAP